MPKQPKSFNMIPAFGSFNFQILDPSSAPPELAKKAFDWNQKVLLFIHTGPVVQQFHESFYRA